MSEDQGGALVGPVEHGELVTATDDPTPLLAGTFAVYQTPDGGFVLVTDIPGRGQETKVIPGKMVRLVTSGVGSKMFGSLFGGGN